MSIKLTPDVYSQNAAWSRQGRNKATAITIQPLKIITQEGEIASASYDTSSLSKLTSRIYSSNTRYLNFNDRQLAKGTVALSSVAQSATITAEKASTGNVAGYITFTGTTYEVARGSLPYAPPNAQGKGYPSFDEMQGSLDKLAEWIRDPNQSGSTKTEAVSILDLSQADLLVAPWVRNNVTGLDTQAIDIFTDWYKEGYRPPAYDSWKTSGRYSSNTGTVDIEMYPPDIWSGEEQNVGPSRLSTKGLIFTSSVSVSRTGDRTFSVSWRAPTQILYMCASRSFGLVSGYHEIDNYAFLIDVTSITVHLHSTAYESEYITYTDGSGRDLLKIDRTQLLHDNTMINLGSSKVWYRELTGVLKTWLSGGLIAATCTVPAEWAIRKNITIDSTVSIVLQDGTDLSRIAPSGGSRVLEFRVVRITKKFSASEFVYELNLMEVPYVELAKQS